MCEVRVWQGFRVLFGEGFSLLFSSPFVTFSPTSHYTLHIMLCGSAFIICQRKEEKEELRFLKEIGVSKVYVCCHLRIARVLFQFIKYDVEIMPLLVVSRFKNCC